MRNKLCHLRNIFIIQCVWLILFLTLNTLNTGDIKNIFYYFIRGIIILPFEYIKLFKYPQGDDYFLIALLSLTTIITIAFLYKQNKITTFLFYIFYAIIWALPGYLFFSFYSIISR